jgi:hypothetical protein
LLGPASIASAPRVAAQDSASVRTVENARPVWAPGRAWTISAKPIVDIGTAGGDPQYQFGIVAGARRLSDGRLVVAETETGQLRFYDEKGAHVRTVGRKGMSPGDFSQIMALTVIAGDTLAVESLGRGHLLFTDRGDYVGTTKLGAPRDSAPPPGVEVGAFFHGGNVIVVEALERPAGTRTGTWTDSIPYSLYRRDGMLVRSLGRYPSGRRARTTGEAHPVAFGPRSQLAGNHTTFYRGYPDTYTIRAYSSNGTLQRIIRRHWVPKPLSASDMARFRDTYANPASTDNGRAAASIRLKQLRARNLQEMVFAKTLPAFSDMIADGDGNLWVKEPKVTDYLVATSYRTDPPQPSEYSVFDSAGRWLGQVTLPARLKVTDIGAGHVVGVMVDQADIHHVVVYRLDKPGTR